jgi:hypothetical protein
MNTTMKHYVNGTGIVAVALDRLPQPEAFISQEIPGPTGPKA